MTLARVPSAIDVTHLPPPNAIDVPNFEVMQQRFLDKFTVSWAEERAKNPNLPAYDVELLQTDPLVVASQAWTYLRLLDRVRVNDAVRALLPAFSRGSDLDHLVSSQNVERKVVVPADPLNGVAAVMESDAQLLRRYLLSFDVPSAGSIGGYIYRAFTAWPAMHDCVPLGYGVHGRRGEMDVVISGPGGRDPTPEERALVRGALTGEDDAPATTSVAVLNAKRVLYDVDLEILVPPGPDPSLVKTTSLKSALEATESRKVIGAEVPLWSIAGAAYSSNVIRVREKSGLVDVPPDPYTIPICRSLSVTAVVQQ